MGAIAVCLVDDNDVMEWFEAVWFGMRIVVWRHLCMWWGCLQGHSCAVSTGGAVSCWGWNGYGQVMLVVCFVFDGLMWVAEGDLFLGDEVFFVQIGDGTTTQRNTPVGVVGLSSGIVMVALGWVRWTFACCVSDVFLWERLLCICLTILMWWSGLKPFELGYGS